MRQEVCNEFSEAGFPVQRLELSKHPPGEKGGKKRGKESETSLCEGLFLICDHGILSPHHARAMASEEK